MAKLNGLSCNAILVIIIPRLKQTGNNREPWIGFFFCFCQLNRLSICQNVITIDPRGRFNFARRASGINVVNTRGFFSKLIITFFFLSPINEFFERNIFIINSINSCIKYRIMKFILNLKKILLLLSYWIFVINF